MPSVRVKSCPENIYRKLALVARRQLLERISSRKITDKAKEPDVVKMIRKDRDKSHREVSICII